MTKKEKAAIALMIAGTALVSQMYPIIDHLHMTTLGYIVGAIGAFNLSVGGFAFLRSTNG